MKISIITPTYNRKQYLPECIASVQKSVTLPYTDITYEHIIYDDASTDGTETYFKEHHIPHVTYIRGTTNIGQSAGKNKAIQQASGEYIMVLDSDDIITERALYYFADAAKQNPHVGWFVADTIRVTHELRYLIGQDYYGWQFKDQKEILKAIFNGEHFIQPNTFFKKQLFDSVHGFDDTLRIAEDIDLYIRFILARHMPMYLHHTSHLMRKHDENTTIYVTPQNHLACMDTLRKKYDSHLKLLGV